VIRCAKVATIDAKDAERIGALAQRDRAGVSDHLMRILAGTVPVAGSTRPRH
jgi:hypothetical protein